MEQDTDSTVEKKPDHFQIVGPVVCFVAMVFALDELANGRGDIWAPMICAALFVLSSVVVLGRYLRYYGRHHGKRKGWNKTQAPQS